MDEREMLNTLLYRLGNYDDTLSTFFNLYQRLSDDLAPKVDGLLETYLRDEAARLIRRHDDVIDALRLTCAAVGEGGLGSVPPSPLTRRLVEYAAALSALGNDGPGPLNAAKELLAE